MPNNIPNSTDYEHPNEPNLVNLHKAMEYNNAGEPHLRVKVDAGIVSVDEINLGVVEIANDEGSPIPVSGTVSINQPIAVTDNGDSLTVDGTISVDNFPATQTVDGTVNIGNEVAINDGGNSITVDGTVEVTGGSGAFPNEVIGTDPYGASVIRIDDTTKQHTSTNRVKTSSQQIMFFNTFQYTKDPQIWDEEITGTAASEFSEFDGCVIMRVNGEAGDQVIRQTRNVMPYIPGRQNELVMAVKYETPVEGIRRRAGIFNELNGMFFEDSGDNYSVVIRKNTASGVVENRVTRDNWNIDKMDGTGPSGIVADPEKIQMLVIEYEWYGAGIVEFKYVIENNSYPIHRFDHANISDTIYTNTPFLPVRLELTDLTGTAGTYEMYQGSTALRMEGGVGPLGREENVATPLTGVPTGTANSFRPILSIRLRLDRLLGVSIPIQFQAASLDNTALFYRVIRNTELTGADWNNVPGNSFCEYDYAATGYTGGEILQTGYISPTNQGTVFEFPKETILQLGRNDLGNTAQTFTILGATTQSNKNVFASLSWVEIR